MAYITNIVVDQGTSFLEDFFVATGEDMPLDLTGYVARLHVRDTFDTKNTRLNLTGESGKLVIDPIAGKVTIKLSPADTTAVKVVGDKLKCVYDLEVESPAGEVFRVAQGSFTITREVTR